MSDLSLETQVRLADVRLKILNREPVSADEFRSLMRDLIRDREGAARASASARRTAKRVLEPKTPKAATPPLNLDNFFPGMSATQENTDGSDNAV